MKIVLIGAGNLATNLGKALFAAGHDFVQVYSRTMESASALATLVGGAPTTDIDNINDHADVYIISVTDSVMAELIPKVCKGRERKLFLHTAGSMPMDVFQGMALHYGVLYPMQTFSKNKEVNFSEIHCFVEANDESTMQNVNTLAGSISNHVMTLNSEGRRHLHLAAVFACNFTNLCYNISSDILSKHNIPFDVMLPLIDETADKVHSMDPIDAQTGPAVRYDRNVIRNQASMLKDNPLVKDLYERMSLCIHQLAVKKI
jgi:predicted short-subunit dehydrogenase-like oxidoreductase (DUF2520 family)